MSAPSERAPERRAPNTHARYPWFDKWLSARSPATIRLTDEAIALIGRYEAQTNPRQRRRKPTDERNHHTMVEAVAMNLAHAVLMPHETGHLAVLTGKLQRPRTRYDHPSFGDTFASIVRGFQGIGWLTLMPSPGMGEASAIAPTTTFGAMVQGRGIGLADFHRGVGETIVLSRDKALIDYPDTPGSTLLRNSMDGLNTFLAEADLAFVDDGLGLVDIHKRHQRRYFSCSPDGDETAFDRGGRMFGGWWSNLPKLRRQGIRIEGEPIMLLDFSSMFVRLAYARMSRAAPDGDLYAIPGFIGHRRAAKLIVNCLLFDEHHRHRWPKVTDPAHRMPDGMTMPRARAAILDHLPDLAPCFGFGLGHELMQTESTILMEVLGEMKGWGLPGLGLHDGLMVPASQATKVQMLMQEVSRQITSATIPVTVEPPAALV